MILKDEMEKIKKADEEEDLRNLEEKRLKEEQKNKLRKEKIIKEKEKEKLEINIKPHEQDIITDKEEVNKNQAIFNLVENTTREYLTAEVNNKKEDEEYKKVNNNTHI